jgi:hypothetical protein
MIEPYRGNTDSADLVELIAEQGLAVVDGLDGPEDLLRLAKSIVVVVPHRDSEPDGVTTIVDLGESIVRSGFAGFSACALNPHTDRSGVPHPPALLMMSCTQAAATGGECVLIDGQAVYDDLAESEPEALTALSTPRSVLFGGAAGHLSSIFSDNGCGRIAVRLRLDELAQFAPEVDRWIPALRAAIDRHAFEFRLTAGLGYVLDNHRWLHGRRAFPALAALIAINGAGWTFIHRDAVEGVPTQVDGYRVRPGPGSHFVQPFARPPPELRTKLGRIQWHNAGGGVTGSLCGSPTVRRIRTANIADLRSEDTTAGMWRSSTTAQRRGDVMRGAPVAGGGTPHGRRERRQVSR